MSDGYYNDTAETHPDAPTLSPPTFILAPSNSAARKAVRHPKNDHLRYSVGDNTLGLWLDFSDPARVCTLGRGETDIYLPDTRPTNKGAPQISDIHAAFQVVGDTGAVLLWDRSDDGTVEPLPDNRGFTVDFCPNAKSVLVARGINSRIAFGNDRWYQFEIQWQSCGLYPIPNDEPHYTMGPRKSRTKKYVLGGEVGTGSYGTVSRAVDATNGKIIAVKRFHKLSGKHHEFASREVANLFRINRNDSIKHEHILQILDCAGGGKDHDWCEILMPLMEGNLRTLVEQVAGLDEHALSAVVLSQMLLALQCIESHNIIHRDVKPENILWEYDSTGDYRFCLGDFGLSNMQDLAKSAAGTEPFMAPEVYYMQLQTTKVDIWSLFATIVWMRAPEFRRRCSRMRAPDLHEWLAQLSQMEPYANMRTMARMDPTQRPSATKQLAILDGQFNEYDQVGDDLGPLFARGMNLQETPEVPYYEPYTSEVLRTYFHDQAGPSKEYVPRSPDPADSPGGYEAFVKTYDDSYGPPDDGDGSGTAVPDTWTAMAPTVDHDADEEPTREEAPRRKHKGRNRA
ncbi:hypothetical protein C8A00DRAFT_17725 [Chaetomidium leptoderma]|uniref:non-specific serine/threonine protein kinase n=1 Tax=Chaetomidium leptoderma TaxID=669021 RepID=A0AAN6ZUQ4_9PEZI|nr:hypothetical protein C8A00DRAFT_17725 [Chaetomidium leptoderma]